jgi:hypothetical protein
MGILVSFKRFLTTGRIGPLHTDLTLNEVAALLGRPSSWIVQPDDAFPAYWTFGKLEIGFDTGTPAPFQMHFFQIELAGSLEGDCEVFCGPDDALLVLALDGLHGKSKPSDFVRAMKDGPPITVTFRVMTSTQMVYMTISNGLVEVLFDADFEGGIPPLIPAAGLARKMDALAGLDSIYAYRKTDDQRTEARASDDLIHTLDAAAYLGAIA